VHAVSHITGGGFYENIPRMLPEGKRAAIKKGSWKVLPIFDLIAERGEVPERDMFNTFNMGIGMMLAVDPADAQKTLDILTQCGETASIVGTVEDGEGGVVIC